MCLSDKIALTKEERIMGRFDEIKNKWERKMLYIGEKLNRDPNESLINKIDIYRIKRENFEALNLLKTEEERYGDYYWYMTLRKYEDTNERKKLEKFRYKLQELNKEKRIDLALKFASEQQNKNSKLDFNFQNVLRLHDLPDGFKSDIIENKHRFFEKIRKKKIISNDRIKTNFDESDGMKKTNADILNTDEDYTLENLEVIFFSLFF